MVDLDLGLDALVEPGLEVVVDVHHEGLLEVALVVQDLEAGRL